MKKVQSLPKQNLISLPKLKVNLPVKKSPAKQLQKVQNGKRTQRYNYLTRIERVDSHDKLPTLSVVVERDRTENQISSCEADIKRSFRYPERHKKINDDQLYMKINGQRRTRLLKPLQQQDLKFECSPLSSSSNSSFSSISVWDNSELIVRGVQIDNKKDNKTQELLKLYKIRFGQFPHQREYIRNSKVVNQLKEIALSNPNAYRQYFPRNKDTILRDSKDYSIQFDLEAQQNWKKFAQYYAVL